MENRIPIQQGRQGPCLYTILLFDAVPCDRYIGLDLMYDLSNLQKNRNVHTEQKPPTGPNNVGMDFHFLVYLARMGATDIHPLGRAATRALIAQIDLHAGQWVLEVGC